MPGIALYDELTPDVASAAARAAERIRLRLTRYATDIIEIGNDLLSIKNQLGHGRFMPWIEAEFGMSMRAAQRFMRVAEVYGTKNANLANLPPSVLYLLSAPSTTDEVRDEAEDLAAAGERLTLEKVAKLKKKLAEAKEAIGERDEDLEIAASKYDEMMKLRQESTNEVLFLKQTIATLQSEVERLKEPGVIHSYPAEPEQQPANVTPIRSAENSRADCLRTAMDLICDRFDGDVAEIAMLIREGGHYTVAAELEAAATRRAEAA